MLANMWVAYGCYGVWVIIRLSWTSPSPAGTQPAHANASLSAVP